jgi:hypothetical protein
VTPVLLHNALADGQAQPGAAVVTRIRRIDLLKLLENALLLVGGDAAALIADGEDEVGVDGWVGGWVDRWAGKVSSLPVRSLMRSSAFSQIVPPGQENLMALLSRLVST